ncbi:MAG: hypothetical protein ACOYBM_05120 [Dethiobacteria bacterium]|jgi:hypothetical protein
MDTNELILRVAEALEKQMAFPQWDTIIQIFSVVAAWITILMHQRLQNKANWTYCIKSKAALIKLYPNDLKQKTNHYKQLRLNMTGLFCPA